ncbi:MAG: hypothetical protein AVDCRST_MAG13-528, partial [uncultured Solirubrobacteraceae bacterium]
GRRPDVPAAVRRRAVAQVDLRARRRRPGAVDAGHRRRRPHRGGLGPARDGHEPRVPRRRGRAHRRLLLRGAALDGRRGPAGPRARGGRPDARRPRAGRRQPPARRPRRRPAHARRRRGARGGAARRARLRPRAGDAGRRLLRPGLRRPGHRLAPARRGGGAGPGRARLPHPGPHAGAHVLPGRARADGHVDLRRGRGRPDGEPHRGDPGRLVRRPRRRPAPAGLPGPPAGGRAPARGAPAAGPRHVRVGRGAPPAGRVAL